MHEQDPCYIVSANPSLSLYRTKAACFCPAVSFSMAFSKPLLILSRIYSWYYVSLLSVIHERSALGDKVGICSKHSRLIGSWNNTKQQLPYGDGNWKILIPVSRGTWHNGTMGRAVRVRYPLDVGFAGKCHISLNAGTSWFRCCALGQCTSPSRASLYSGVNEYMF